MVRMRSVQGKRHLTDANIADVYRTMRSSLPDSVLLLTPAEAHMVAMASPADARQHIAEMNFEQKNIVLMPINDASDARGSEGKHWSLLALLRSSDGVE